METGKADAMAVTLNGESAIIPRFETLEAFARQALRAITDGGAAFGRFHFDLPAV